MDVEVLAVAEVKRRLALCPHITAVVSDADKVLLTDGHVDLFSHARKRKADYIGRVPVQVKGLTTKVSGKIAQSFSLKRIDLAGYRAQGGVVFFGVLVHTTTGACTVAFRALTPFGIDELLETGPKNRAKISVPLAPVPPEISEVEQVFMVAFAAQDQRSPTGFSSSLIEDAEGMTMQLVRPPDFTTPVTISAGSGEAMLRLQLQNGLSVPLPGSVTLFPSSYLPQEVDATVRAGEVTFRGFTVKQIDEGVTEVVLSDGLRVVTSRRPSKKGSTFTLKPDANLTARIKDMSFYVTLAREGAFFIDDKRVPFPVTDDFDSSSLEDHLATLKRVQELFELLHIDANLVPLTSLTADSVRAIQYMHMSLVDGVDLSATEGAPGLLFEDIGVGKVALLVTPGSSAGKWRYLDPLALENHDRFRVRVTGDQATQPATFYDALEEELPYVLNLNLHDIVGAYAAISEHPHTSALANLRVLQLISAGDAHPARRSEFLGAALDLNAWLSAREAGQPEHSINRWQVLRRCGLLHAEDRSEIRTFRRDAQRGDAQKADLIDAMCAILLGSKEDIEDSLARLTQDQRAQIRTWPIWGLTSPD